MTGGPGWDNRGDSEKAIIAGFVIALIIGLYILGKLTGG